MSSLPRRLIFFCLALLVSGATVFAVQHWLHAELANRQPGSTADAAPARPTAQVLVAKGDLPAGTFLRADMLRWQEWPRDTLDDSYVVQDKAKLEDFVGTVVRSRLTSGEPITAGRVARSGDRGFMAGVLSPGSRAVTVNVTPSTGMAGFVSPGDRVDLLLTMVVQPANKDEPTRHMSETVLTDLRVLAMDQRISEDNKDITVPKTATLEVTPKQAEMVAVASELGLLSLSLRSLAAGDGTDDARDSMMPTWDSEATHLTVKKETAVVPHRIQIVRGTEATELTIGPAGAAGPSIVSGPSSGGAASGAAATASGLLGAITGFLGK
jgi:pilus assembly protein CpaB